MIKEGKLSRIIFNNSGNGYTVAVFTTDEGSFRIAGAFAEPKIDTRYRLEGKFVIHPRYGEQFSVSSYEEILPEGEEAILEFLSAGNIRGIGPKTAKLLVETFGEETLKVIEETPEKLLQISGIGAKSLEKITSSFGESQEFARVSIELRELGIEMSDAVKIYKIYGSESVGIVRENPYILVEDIRGITFPKADEIAGRLGFEPESVFRIESGIRFKLRNWAASGSTLMPEDLLAEDVAQLLDTQVESVKDQLSEMIFNGELEEDTIDDIHVIYLYGYYHAEQRVAYNIARIRNADIRMIPADIENLINDAQADRKSVV